MSIERPQHDGQPIIHASSQPAYLAPEVKDLGRLVSPNATGGCSCECECKGGCQDCSCEP
jgi:hypothetical protein